MLKREKTNFIKFNMQRTAASCPQKTFETIEKKYGIKWNGNFRQMGQKFLLFLSVL